MNLRSLCDIAYMADFGNSEYSTIGGVAKVGEFFTGTKRHINYRYYDPENKPICEEGENGEIIIPCVIFLPEIFLLLTFDDPHYYDTALIYELMSREFHYVIYNRTSIDLLKKQPKYIGHEAVEFLEELEKTSSHTELLRLEQEYKFEEQNTVYSKPLNNILKSIFPCSKY